MPDYNPNLIIIGGCPPCQGFAAAWYSEIIRHEGGALAHHINHCPACGAWDRKMKESSP